MKPTTARKRMLYMSPLHLASKQLSAPLSDELQEKYHHSARVIEGDTVKVMRGEFKGIEGKVTNISTEKRGIAIEGIKREKLKGGSVDIYIHASNVMITTLNLEDKWRQSRLEGQKPKTVKQQPQEPKEIEKPIDAQETVKPKENPKEEKVSKKEQKPKQKESKASDKPEKKEKQVKSTKSKRSEK